MAEIIFSDVRKSFEQDRVILDGVSFQIDKGERAAILGDNGTGKTTLLRMITGELQPDSGYVSVPKARRIGYVAQLNTARSGDTVEDVLRQAYREVISIGQELDAMHADMAGVSANRYDELTRRFEALGGYDWQAELARIAAGLGIDADLRQRPFDKLSGGEQTRVNLARIIMEKTDILLLDEPTNHLDMQAMEWLEEYLDTYKGTVLLVSHDRYFLDRCVKRIIELDNGKADLYSGNYTFYVEEREQRRRLQLLHYEQEQAKVKQLEFQIARLKAWGSVYDNPALHKKAAAMEKRVERVQKTEKPTEKRQLSADFSSESFRADRVLRIEGLSKGFGGQKLFENITCEIRGGGERVALLGPNGCGKTTLLKILTGETAPDTGTFAFGPSVRWAYLPQIVSFDHPERTLYDTMLYETDCTPQEARDRLGSFRFIGDEQFKTVSQLSGGEKTRLRSCMLMMRKVNLLILDEPTNHLDLSSREWVEEAVSRFEGTLLFVSHDRYFIKRFAGRIWDLDGGFRDYDADYERYRRIKALEAAKEKEEKPDRQPPKQAEKQPDEKPRRDPRTERRLAALERDIARREAELAVFDDRMAECGSDYEALLKLGEEKEQLEKEIEAMYGEWERMSEGL